MGSSPSLLTTPTPRTPNESDASNPNNTIPTIDFSLLTSGDPHQRSKVIQDIDKSCQEWGFFMLVNHGVPESLMKAVLNGCNDFFNLPMEEKLEFATKDIWKPISEIVQEYCKRSREVTMELLKAISESLGFEESYIEKAMNLKSGFQLFAANLYPPCPQPELAMGIPAHTDHGLLTLLIENEIGGLQIQHNGTWFHVNPLPNSYQNFPFGVGQ
ncbi:hypothetical protein Acr_00g0038110 [Actinidia rufa]|uniref:2-oxoglutarate (2OG) and Fe(II)-dependent oxygenase superfamily protein n=1 Tax=Actinidia rufa TaxID=165716 RepID=A0A7J0DH26_9ERIC|nr:hypothetical protein Acr_00g0038110 [Actinidia rufa]